MLRRREKLNKKRSKLQEGIKNTTHKIMMSNDKLTKNRINEEIFF